MPNNKQGKRIKEETKKLKKVKEEVEKNKSKDAKKAKQKNKKQHPKLKMFLKILLIIILLLCVVGAGIVAAVMFGFFGNDFEITKEELIVGSSNSIVLDKNGNEIANLSSDEKRKTISINEMSPYLPKAYVAIEDKRFYKHNGVDVKRTTGAIIGAVTGKSSYGGSSITQQLVKNITKDDARSGLAGVVRKMKEWSKAVQVERMISKDQILELYLNIIFVGGPELHGVELGSEYYFNKSAKDLDLAQCAFLAGINNSPNKYNPYDSSLNQDNTAELRKERTLTVLKEMKSQGFIENEDDYNNAVKEVEDGLKFENGYKDTSNYSYHTASAVKQVIEQVMNERNISEDLAKNYVYGSGLKIYSTEDPTIQARVEEELQKEKYQFAGKKKDANGNLYNDHTQAAMVIIDNQTNQVVAVGGSLGEQNATGLNRATQSLRQTGSSMKPLADIVPGLEEKVITAATVYDDKLTDFGGGYQPKDWNTPKGLMNIRSCIRTSQNIPMVKIMVELTPKKSIEYLKKMGITTLTDNDNNIALSIGGLSRGISPLEMAGAYSSIANDGVYTKPTFYTKVEDASGNVVLTANQEKTKVMSEQNAYITRSIIEEPLQSGGTATYCKISGMETCAKTGSTDNYVDRWLCGMTPYYTAACWFGYDNGQEPLKYGNGTVYSVDGRNPAGQIWVSVMKDIHQGLENKNFSSQPSGIVQKTICRDTGCVATDSCTNTYTEIFSTDNVPDKCQGHGTQKICQVSGKLANEYCPADQVKTVSYGGVAPKEQLKLWKTLSPSRVGTSKIDEVCTIHKKSEEKPKNETKNEVVKDKNPKNETGNKNTTASENKAGENKTSNENKTPSGTTNDKPKENPAAEKIGTGAKDSTTKK